MPWLRKNSPWILILVGSVAWSLTMIKSGVIYDFGMGFWGPNGHDGVWHISLIESLSRGSSDMPIFSGSKIQNYHLGFDIFVAALHKLTAIPTVNLYFQILPPLFAFFIGFLTYRITRNNWSVFFVYFGGSLGWLLGKGESAFWAQQSISTLVNPPYALSLIIFLLGLLLLQRHKYLLSGLVFGLLPFVKIYAGILAFIGLFVAGFKNRNLFKTLIIGLLIYLPTNYQLLTNNSKLLVWNPGWFLETMMGLSDRVNWTRYYQAMIAYRQSVNLIKFLPAYFIAFLIFLFGNLGTRVVVIFRPKISDSQGLFILTVVLAGTVIPQLFLQSGTPWNTIQFFYYSLFFASLLAGQAMTDILKIKKLNNYLKIGIWSLVIALTLPTTYATLANVYLPSRPPAKISREEIEALTFLSRQPPGIVLTPPANPDPYAPPPRPLYLYESTAYVSAFSSHPVYLEDQVNLDITGYDWPFRRKLLTELFTTTDTASATKFLETYNISYIYLPQISQVRPVLSETQLGFQKIFENSQASIWGRGATIK